jgi:hypothetical protein
MRAEEHCHGARGPDEGGNQEVVRGNQGNQEVMARADQLWAAAS